MSRLFTSALWLAATLALVPVARANSSNGQHNIVAVVIHDSGNVIVVLDGHSNTESCATAGSENEILVSNQNANFKLFYAMALAAQAQSKPVYGWVNGCTDVWGNGSLKIPTATTLQVAS